MNQRSRVAPILFVLVVLLGGARTAAAEEPVVRAVVFFLPACGHCEYVITEVLPGVFEAAGGAPDLFYDEAIPPEELAFSLMSNGRLEILLVDTSISEGADLFIAASAALDIESAGVPRLVVGDRYLIGSEEIPEEFPGIVLDTLDAGGTIDWPAIPGLAAALHSVPIPEPAIPASSTTSPSTTTSNSPGEAEFPTFGGESPWDRFRTDPVGNSISVAVLAVMSAALIGVWVRMRRSAAAPPPGGAIALLAVIGLGVAVYLTFVEVGGSEAVCGPVGDCNAVQQSDYARLFGVIPIGVLGVIGYSVILTMWGMGRLNRRHSDVLTIALFAGTVAGVFLSAYLTFLEPFVIGATCAWCLTSAVIITALMWLAARPAASAWSRMRHRRQTMRSQPGDHGARSAAR